MSITKSQNARVMSEEAIQYLCKCINLINSLPTSVIDNLHLADNLTFSSTKIDSLLTILKEDCNKYTDSIVANLSRLELKVVTDEADMIEHNKLYLIKKDGETNYSQYVIVTNDSGVDEKILLGTCDISMTDYLKITDADSTYCKKTDFDTLKTVLTSHTSDTDAHVSATDKEILKDVNNKKHEHSNKIQLDKISESDKGELMYDGRVVNSMYISEETNIYNNNSSPHVTLYFTILGNRMTIFLIQRASSDGLTINIKYPIPFKSLPTITRTYGDPYGNEKTTKNTLTEWSYDQNYGGANQNELHFMIQGTI